MPIISKPLPSLERLHQALRLDVETGHLFWRSRPLSHFKNLMSRNVFNASHPGCRADKGCSRGYRRVRISFDGVIEIYGAHRIIWKLVHGDDPVDLIDHIDCNTANNRPANLREASVAENRINSIIRPRGCVSPSGKRFRARLTINGVSRYLGCFASEAAAKSAIASEVAA